LPREHINIAAQTYGERVEPPAGAGVCAAVSRGCIDVVLFVLGPQRQARLRRDAVELVTA
jgi:hypothetical protein